MQDPLVSIIIPVYNLAPYLPVFIRSIVRQTYTNTELIFINDGSKDNSLEVLAGFQQEHKNIRVITQPNGGPGPARNAGIDAATGKYLVFVDGDDWLEPETLTQCVEEAERTNPDIVCFGYKRVTQTGDRQDVTWQFEYNQENYTGNDYVLSCLSEECHRKDKIITAVWGKLYKTSLLQDNRIRFRIPHFEDTPFVLETAFYAKLIRFIGGTQYNYFIRDKNAGEKSETGGAANAQRLAGLYEADELMKDFLISKNVFEKYRHAFNLHHNTRVLLYGGYYQNYVDDPGSEASHRIFMEQLLKNKKTLTWDRKGVYRQYRKRIFMLNIGAIIGSFSIAAARRFFLFYERTMAPE